MHVPRKQRLLPPVDQLLTDLHEHIEDEKNEVMPRPEEKLSGEECQDLANLFENTKIIVPTGTRLYHENFAAMLGRAD